MFYSSINSQDLSIVPIGISTPPSSDGAYGLSTEFLNPLINIKNTSAVFSIESELIKGSTNYSLSEKIISADYLIREKFSNFLTNHNINDLLGIAYGEDYQINLAQFLLQSQINDGFKDVQISVINSEILGNANGAYAESINTIFLGNEFINSNSTQVIAQVITEEFGHFLDAQINETDSQGDEGDIFAKLVFNQSLTPEELNSLKAENDHGIIQFNDHFINIEKSAFILTNNTEETLAVTENTTLVFQWTQREARYNNEVGIIVFDNPEGKIDGISPQEAGYFQKVLTSGKSEVIFSKGNSAGNWKQVDLKAGDYVGFYLIQNGSSSEYLNNPNSINIFSSITSANTDNFDHVLSTNLGNNIYCFNWEDLTGGGDKDFNDVVFNVFEKGFKGGINNTQTVPLTVEFVSNEAAYRNEIGFYYVDDINGNINGISPGDANYAKEVFKQDNYQVTFGEGNYGGIKEYSLKGNQYIGWYLIADNTSQGFLQTNPNNNPNGEALAYFSYAEANPDKLNHLIHYSSNQMGWEDIFGGGDKDYNDIVFNFNFGTPTDINPQTNNPPVADIDKTITVEKDSQPIALDINPPTDFDGDTLTIMVNQLPENSKGKITKQNGSQININDSLTITELANLIFTPVADSSGNAGSFVYTVTDGKGGNDSQRIGFNITTNNIVSLKKTNNAPEFISESELEIIVGENYSYDANAIDEDNDTLFYSLLIAPEGLNIDNNTGVISWENATVGNHNISILVEDGKGGQDRQDYSLSVVTEIIDQQLNRPPVFVSTPVVYGNINTEYRYEASATDADNDDLTYSVINAPNGLIIDENTGVITWTPTTLGEVEITLQVNDGKGGIATQKYNILVQQEQTDNYAPVIISEAIVKASTSQNYVYDVNAIDPDADNLTYSLVTAPQGMTINESTGEIIWNTATQTIGNYDVSVRVNDNRGGVDTQDFVVALNNNPLGTITGFKWEDANGNGFRDTALVQGDNPDVVFVLDVSGSADFAFAGSSIGDLNNDSRNNTRLDAEIAGFIALNQQLITQGLGTRANVAVIVFSGSAANADMDLVTSGVQLTATPTTDVNSNGVADVEEILRSIRSGAFRVGNTTGTNIEAALQKVEATFTAIGTETGNGNLVFLTDGESNRGGSITNEVERLKAKGFNLSAFGVGNDASLTEIKTIDADAIKFTSTDELLGVFGGLKGEERFIESGLAGVTVYLDLNNNGTLDINEPTQITASDDPNTPNIDETGQYKFTGLEAGTYFVREVVPTDYEQTYPVGDNTNQGDGYADVVLDFFDSGEGPIPGPYGSNIGTSEINIPVSADVVLGAPPDLPFIDGNDPNVDFISLPRNSFITVGFTDEIIIDAPGNDIFIRSLDDAAGEMAEISVSADGVNFVVLDEIGEGGSAALDLANYGFTEPVIGTTTIEVRVVDPSDTSAPIIEINKTNLEASQGIIKEPTDIIATVTDNNLEFYRVEIAPVEAINLDNLGENDSDYVLLSEGNSNITNQTVANLDPRLLANGSHFVKITAFDFSGNGNVQGVILNVSGQNKPGDFSLEYTDLSIPLTGIPIEITRRYNSLESSTQGDFGYGWDLGLQDANIVEASPDGRDLSDDASDIFGTANTFSVGTRITLNTPDGRRVGFTFNPVPVFASFFGTTYAPSFTPDAGVFDKLEAENASLSIRSDGKVGAFLFSFIGYNPSKYKLTTKDGTVYNYDQNFGLIDVKDRNGNTLTFSDEGIVSSTGAEIEFLRDSQGRITEIIDPDGKSVKYSYDSKGNLVAVNDRTNNKTELVYNKPNRQHLLTEIIDPLGRKATRTEYDENGQISKIIDANGNELEINFDAAASSQTIKDPFGNNITRIFDNQGNVIQEVDQLGGITLRTYDANNNLLSETDPEGNTTSYTYDNRGNILTETDGEGNKKTYTYNAKNDILTETDALGNKTIYTYDVSGNLTKREDKEGNVTTYNYGANGLLTTVIDANSKTSTFSYDNFGNLRELIDPTGAKTTFTYDRNGRVKSVTDALGAITNYIYDDQGRLIEKADPEGSSCGCARGITKTEYNAAGEKIAETDALGRRTEYRYNERGLLIETILPDSTPDILTDNPRTKNEYDALDRLTIFTDELGRKTYYVYDKLGRQIEVIYADNTPNNLEDNPRTKKEYDKAGLVIAEIDELGNRTELKYDNAERLISRTNALNEVTTYTYDPDGRQISMTDALGRKTTYSYDNLDRLDSTIYANNTAMTTSYDGLGRVIAETDLAGNTTNYEYDALGRLTTVIDALNQRTEYKYDAVGNLIEQKDANGNITKFEYDSLRRLQATILPEGQENETIHDKIGNLIEVTDFNGVVTTYKYNERNWLIEKSFSDGTPTETFTYTLTGELATVTDNRGVTTYSYDERDRLISRTEPDGRKIEYIYDNAGNILTLNVPSGTTTYTYDKINRIDTVKDADNGVTDYDYDAVGNLIKTKFGNGVIENQQYDLLNRLTYLENRNQTNVISSYTYTLDSMGNRLKVEENDGRIVEYTYDKLYRLTQEKTTDSVVGNKTIQYQFDAVGNRLQKNDSVEGTTTYSYDNNDRLLQETLGGKVTNYQYDNEGNLKAKVENGTTQAEYEWNAKGELTAVEVTENGETGRIEFEYDHNGIRVAINVDGEETRFLIDNNQQQYAQVIEEYQINGDVKTTYTHGWDLISQDNGNNRIYYQVDGLGSTRQLTDINGAVVVEYDYDAYGNLTRKVGDADNNYLFAGEQFDDAVDGYYLRARYYDSLTGRFVSTDPFEGYNNQPITLHDYLYAGVNPVNAIDPSGEAAFIEFSTLTGKIAFAAFLGATYGIVGKVTCVAASGETITLEEIAIAGLFGAAVPVILGLVTASLSIGAYGFLWTTKINPFIVKPATGAIFGCKTIDIIVSII